MTGGDPLADSELGTITVHDSKPRRGDEALLEGFDDRRPDEGFVRAYDHGPKPFYLQFAAETGPEFQWSPASVTSARSAYRPGRR